MVVGPLWNTLTTSTPPYNLMLDCTQGNFAGGLNKYFQRQSVKLFFTYFQVRWLTTIFVLCFYLLVIFIVLDPQISYSGLLADCGGDLSKSHLEIAKDQLSQCYCEQYICDTSHLASACSITVNFVYIPAKG